MGQCYGAVHVGQSQSCVWMIETGSVNGSNESVKFGFKIDFKILMDRISKFRPDHDMALVDIVYHCCFRSVRWRARYIAMNRSKSRFKIGRKKIMDRISQFRPDHDMALMGIVDHCSFRSVRWSARGGVVKTRRKSVKIHTHTHTN